jgi:acyl-CoA hydrolase
MPPEEVAKIHENPYFELYDFGYTDDLRRLIQQENFVAVNNALCVDLTGQVSAEALDHRPYTGVGGQTVFMLAAELKGKTLQERARALIEIAHPEFREELLSEARRLYKV